MKSSSLKKILFTSVLFATPLVAASCNANFIPEDKDKVLKDFSLDFLSKVVANQSGSKYYLIETDAKTKSTTTYITPYQLYLLLEVASKNTTGATSYTITFGTELNYLWYYVSNGSVVTTGSTHISGTIDVTSPNTWVAKDITGYKVPNTV